ncbi:hypothetical protein ACLQ3C_09265 [Gordonia sp. DT30]|uniref:hypothetical protein n=1 Tax=Gordonia sp. DT30 TaxID=3416546 RepID=UPI003CF667E4
MQETTVDVIVTEGIQVFDGVLIRVGGQRATVPASVAAKWIEHGFAAAAAADKEVQA